MAYKLRSRILNAISNFLKPVKGAAQAGKAIVGTTRYRFKLLGAIINASTPKYDFRKLRQIYRRFGFIRQGLAVYKHRATSELPDIICDNIKARNTLMERLERMKIFDQLPDMFQDLTVFGNVFYEILFDESEISKKVPLPGVKSDISSSSGFQIEVPEEQDVKRTARRLKGIVGIKRLEPDYMRVVRDKSGRVQYYVSVRDPNKYVLLEHWRVIHITLDSLPGDAFGIGLIEGAIDDIAALRMVEDLQLQLIKHDIYPFRVFSCPTNDVVMEVEAKLSEQERFGDLVVPGEVNMKQSTVGNASQDLRALMHFYKEKIFMDIGVPMQMLIEGSKTNRATATVQSDSFNQNVYAFINQVYIPMERFSKLVLLFEGIDSDVVWNYKDIDRSGETVLRNEVVEWFKEGIVDREDAITLIDTYGGFRYMSTKDRNKIVRKSKPKPELPQPEEGTAVDIPPVEGEDGTTPELGDRIADTTNIDQPSKITDRIKERVTKPDGTRVEKTTERIRQVVDFAEKLRDEIMDCNFDKSKIAGRISNLVESNFDAHSLNGQLTSFCDDISLCLELHSQDKNDDQYEYLVSKTCADFSRSTIGKIE